jgi:hypothetical protein
VALRLIVSEAPDLTTIRVVGRLRDDGVALLVDACERSRRPLVLDLSEMTSLSEAGVLLLGRLAGNGVHMLGASQYVRLLLHADAALSTAGPRKERLPPPRRAATVRGRPRRRP